MNVSEQVIRATMAEKKCDEIEARSFLESNQTAWRIAERMIEQHNTDGGEITIHEGNESPHRPPLKSKKQGWVNIYHEWVKMEQQANGSWQATRLTRPSSQVFESREYALEAIKYNAQKEWEYVDTIRIEWEE